MLFGFSSFVSLSFDLHKIDSSNFAGLCATLILKGLNNLVDVVEMKNESLRIKSSITEKKNRMKIIHLS